MKTPTKPIYWELPLKRWHCAVGATWLEKDARFWGKDVMYYDGTFASFGLWFFCLNWTDHPYAHLSEEEIKRNIEESRRRYG